MNDSSSKVPIEKVAQRFQYAVTLAIVLTLVLTAAAMVGGVSGSVVAIRVDGQGLSQSATAATAVVVGGLCVAFLWYLRSALMKIGTGDFFGRSVRSRLARASLFMLLACLANILLPTITMLIWPQPGVANRFALEANGSDGLWLLTAASFYLITKLLERAAAFEADSLEII